MIYKEYGKLGFKVSAVGFGGMRFDLEKSMEENAELVRYANSKGITYFDTAPGYCKDLSEDIFGIALQDMPGKWTISTKGMPTEFDTAEKAYNQVRKSLDRLKVDKIDFYHVWCLRKMEHFELAMKPGGQYDGLLRAKEEGLIDHIVFSSHQPGDQIKQVIESEKFDGVLLGMNILNFPYRWDGAQAAADLGYGVAAMNPLCGGEIPKNEKSLGFLCSGSETPTEAALRFALATPQITISLVGFTTKEHIDMACRIADECEPYSEEDLKRIESHIGENMNAVCTGCGYCLECPVGIPIPSYLQYYNQKQMFGMSDEDMIKNLGFQHDWGMLASRKASAADCTECGKCESDCTQHLPIIERLKEIAAWEAEEV